MAPHTRATPFAVVSSLAVTLVVASCRSAPQPIEPPQLGLQIVHYVGGALEGVRPPVADPPKDDLPSVAYEDIAVVDVRVFALRRGARSSQSAGDERATTGPSREARLLLAPESDSPIRGRLRLENDVQLAFGDAAEGLADAAENAANTDPFRGVLVAHESGVLFGDVVAQVAIERADGLSRELALSLDGGTVRVALEERGPRSELEQRSALAMLAHRLDPWSAGENGARLWMEWPLAPGTESEPTAGDTLGVAVRVRAAAHIDRAAVARTFRRAEREINLARDSVGRAVIPVDAELREQLVRSVAWSALGEPRSQRSALITLLDLDPEGVDRTRRVLIDYAATLDADGLSAWVGALQAAADAAAERGVGAGPEAEDLGWEVARAGLLMLGRRADQDVADPAEVGMLLRGFGEVGRFPSEFVRAASGAASGDDFAEWLIDENRRLLASTDPAARVRALDWLCDAGVGPADFDPFASRDERREALRNDELRRATEQLVTEELVPGFGDDDDR